MNFNMGFAKNSCETQLIQLVEDLGRQLSLGKQTDLILLDFSKAFDKVNHLKLLYKLSCFGVKGNTLDWIQSFLIGRTQTVVLDGESSEEIKQKSNKKRRGNTPNHILNTQKSFF